jgi:hypothetical protein
MGGFLQENKGEPHRETERYEGRDADWTPEPIDGAALGVLGFGRGDRAFKQRPIAAPKNSERYPLFIIGLCKVHTGGRE